ncbi:MAG: DNA/RNA helicase domain-containing protein, partial [Abditibacteriaceae bacterium]
MIKEQNVYVSLDDQQVVFNSVLNEAHKAFHNKAKVILLVKGGPGTGKSVIPLNLVEKLSRLGYNTQHATGSKAVAENY